MRSAKILAVLMFILFCSNLFADQIVMKNGDRLTGTIIKSDDKSLVIKTDYAGEITVKWPDVQDLSSTQDLHVGLKNGQTVVGSVATKDGNLKVATKTGSNVVDAERR